MSRPRLPLPEEFERRSFGVAEARALGLERNRLAGRDLAAPFRGVRVRADARPETIRDRALAFAPRLRPHQAFGGLSAAALHGLPIPPRRIGSSDVELVVEYGRNLPRGERVRARRVAPDRWSTTAIDDVRVASPLLTLETLVAESTPDELGILADALRSTSFRYPGLAPFGRPLVEPAVLERLADDWGGRTGAAKLRRAIAFSRDGVESPMESLLRWTLVEAGGLPEPEIGVGAFADGEFLGTPDLSYPELRIAIEYEGDEHRVDRARWRRDIARVRLFEAHGWIVVRVTIDDLVPDPSRLIARIRALLSARAG